MVMPTIMQPMYLNELYGAMLPGVKKIACERSPVSDKEAGNQVTMSRQSLSRRHTVVALLMDDTSFARNTPRVALADVMEAGSARMEAGGREEAVG